jgi:PadR family transcriptional regulator PadR
MDQPAPELFNNLRLELRRGLLIVAVGAEKRRGAYVYTLRKDIAARGIEIDEGTLYPLLRRLESQGLLGSEWREENNRQKRFYKLSRDGRVILKQLLAELEKINASLTRII